MFSVTSRGASISIHKDSHPQDANQALILFKAYRVSQVETSEEQVSKTLEFENHETSEPSIIALTPLKEEFLALLNNYDTITMKVLMESKIKNPNDLINLAYSKLENFVELHPEFLKILPLKVKCSIHEGNRSIAVDVPDATRHISESTESKEE